MKNAYNTSAYGSFAYVYDMFMDNVTITSELRICHYLPPYALVEQLLN